MDYIKDLKDGDQIKGIYFCKQKIESVSKTGKEYFSVKLMDKTGVVDGKVWDPTNPAISNFDSGLYVHIEGDVTTFNNQKQIRIERLTRAREGEYDVAEYMPVTDENIPAMYEELMQLKNKVTHPKLRQLLDSFFVEDEAFIKAFKGHSAAKSVHHNFVGGLLQHTLRVTRICNFFADQYKEIKRDLILTAAMFHDIGKIQEISDFPENDYTDDGQMIGHIVIGYQMVKEHIDRIEHFPKELETELLHCILAHQGKMEFGSPKKPVLLEAMALYYADDSDAKIEIMIEEFKKNSALYMGQMRFLDNTNIRKTTGFDGVSENRTEN